MLYLAFKEPAAESAKGFPLVFEITLRQIYFTGVQALRVVTFVSLTLGAIVIIQSGSKVGLISGSVDFVVEILVPVILREIGPLLTAFIVIGRSGMAIAAELGNMIVAHEMEANRPVGLWPGRKDSRRSQKGPGETFPVPPIWSLQRDAVAKGAPG